MIAGNVGLAKSYINIIGYVHLPETLLYKEYLTLSLYLCGRNKTGVTVGRKAGHRDGSRVHVTRVSELKAVV